MFFQFKTWDSLQTKNFLRFKPNQTLQKKIKKSVARKNFFFFNSAPDQSGSLPEAMRTRARDALEAVEDQPAPAPSVHQLKLTLKFEFQFPHSKLNKKSENPSNFFLNW